ncbi:uncharacterized protein LOC116307805 [Actinia tenebrosa]|uniref:Uncharacterized protein LOC116307805 n=1 Tax=Actinia tenebrosa TaxID=6105 RepID=A0A6P8JB52_ACTTE|nr:uncharacterized protein LOC116307805 [Actinia tenebrosa]
MACVIILKLVIILGAWNVNYVFANVDVLARLMTDNITSGDTAKYGGIKWKKEFETNLKQGVYSVEKRSLAYTSTSTGKTCIRNINSDCNDVIGVQFWMRYKGFISDILADNTEYHTKLFKHLSTETPNNVRWLSCFNSRHHGWNMVDFHTKCDNKGPTVSLFKIRDDAIFGGFTTADWGGASQYADKGFLFSLKNVDNKTLPILTLNFKDNAIKSLPASGPIFGNGDLVIGSNPQQDGNSNCDALGTDYHLPNGYTKGTDDAKTLLAGSDKFALSAMEVFYMECSSGLGMDSGRIENSSLTSASSSTLEKDNVRLKSNTVSPINDYLKVQLTANSFITGFAVRAQSCAEFNITYEDANGDEQDYQENGSPKEFVLKENVTVRYALLSSISTSAIKFVLSQTGCKLAVEIYGCDRETFDAALGMESGAILDNQITASSIKEPDKPHKYSAWFSRANQSLGEKGCWKSSADAYLQIDLLVVTTVTAIGIQRCAKDEDHPKKVKIEYALEDQAFLPYNGNRQFQHMFDTSELSGTSNVKKLELIPPIAARLIRIYPHDEVAMRAELYGFVSNKNYQLPTTLVSTGNFSFGQAGFGVSVYNSTLEGKAVTKTKTSIKKSSNPVSFAKWTRVTYWTVIDTNDGILFENDQEARVPSVKTNSDFPTSKFQVVTIDHSTFNSSNPENIQLSDVTVWRATTSDKNALKADLDKIADGPVVFKMDTPHVGSASVPYLNKGWNLLKSCTGSQPNGTGPCIGSQGGAFLYLEASDAFEGSNAIVESYHRVSAYKCFSFAYHMWGQNVGRLNVYARDFYGETKLVWRLGGDQGNRWHQANISLSQPRAFKIIIEGVVGDGFQGDIAVDSFHFRVERCESTPPVSSPTYSTGFAESKVIGVLKQGGYLMNMLKYAGAPNTFWKPCFIKSRQDTLEGFWQNCKERGPTVVVGKKDQYIFGAYSDRDWAGSPDKDPSTGYEIASSKAFIFSLTNPSSTPKVFPIKPSSRSRAILINSANGPHFGQGLEVTSSFTVKTNLGQDYGQNVSDASYLTGTSSFTPDELEVFYPGDFPCDKWCALPDWKCKETNAKCECDYSDRLIHSCLKGQPQAFLGIFDSYDRSPDTYWNFDEHPKILDVKTQRSVPVSSGSVAVPNGISRKAIKLDGTASVTLGDYANTCIFDNSSAGLSVSLWIKYATKAGADRQTLFTIGHSDKGDSRLQISHPNSTSEELSIMVNANNKRLSYRFRCPSNVWSHLVISWTSPADSLVVFRNGKPVDIEYDICFGCAVTGAADTSIYLGEQSVAPVAWFDEIGIWCKGLTSQEADEIFRFFQGPPGFRVFMYMEFKDKLWSDYSNFESNRFNTFKDGVISWAKTDFPGITANDISFHCGGPSFLTCNITIGVDFNDGDTTISLYNGGLKNNIIGHSQTGVSNKVMTISGYNTSAYSINVSLEVPGGEDEQWSGIYQGYTLLYYPMNDPSLIKNITQERYVTQWSFENLTSYMPYNVTLQLHYLGGTYRTLKTIIWTGERVPETAPLNFEAMPLNSTCIKLQWQDPQAPVPGRIRGFQIKYNRTNENDFQNETLVVYYFNKTIYLHELCGLPSETEYQVQIAAFTIGLGPFTELKTTSTTGKSPTSPPINVTSLNGTKPHDPISTCLITWLPPPPETTNGNLTSYRVVYSKRNENKTIYSEIGVCNTSKLLKELDLYSIYDVVVAAANQKGLSPYSTPVYCYTEGTVPGAPPSNVRVRGNSQTSCLVQWGQVPVALQNGLILGYNITYLKQDDPSAELKFVLVTGALSNTTELLSLEIFTKYNITIAAYTIKGLGNETGLHATECMTWESAPDGVPQNLAIMEKSNVSCKFSWSGIPANLANGIILGYEAVIENVNSTDIANNFTGFQVTCASDLNATFKDLKPFHMYNITVSGFNSRAVSNKSEPLQCLTEEDQPLIPPPNLRCKMKTSSVIEVCWDEIPLILRQGIVREYKIFYQVLNQSWWYSKSLTEDTVSTPPVFCWNLTDLEEYSSYSMKAKAVTIKEGNFSYEPVECKTGEGVPREAPLNVRGRNTSAYSLKVEWDDLPREPPGILRGYLVSYRVWNASEDTTQNASVSLKTKTLEIGGLQLFTLYCLQVAAVTVGPGIKTNCTYVFTDSKWLPPPDGIPGNVTQLYDSTERNCSLQWRECNNSNPDPDGRVLGYNVYYRISGTNDTETVIKVTGNNSTQQILQSLEEFTNYEIRVAAFNLYGAGNKSEIMYCQTKEAAPSQPPPNITAQNASSTSVQINWFDIPRFEQNGVIRWYYIKIFERALVNTSSNYTTILKYRPSNLARRRRREIAIDEHSQTITGLKKFTEYGVQLYGYTIKEGPLSPVVYVKTAEDAPSKTVANLTIRNSSSTSILLEWNNVPPDYRHGIIRSFVIYYWLADWPLVVERNITLNEDQIRVPKASARRLRRSLSSAPEYRFNLTGLQIWTNYSLQVAANTIKVGPRTNETILSTDEDIPCLPPHYITFDIPKPSSLRIQWKDVQRHCRNGIILGYRLIYKELPNKPSVIVNFTASERYYDIENMNSDANYTVELMAFTRIGDGNASFDLAQPDKMGPRSKPINVTTFNFTTPTTLTVEWKPIEDDTVIDKLLGYRVSWKVLSEGEEIIEDAPWYNYTVRKDTVETVIGGLLNYAHYQVEISGFTRGGNGPSGVVWGDTCRCFKRVTTNYRIFSPYNSVSISADLKTINMSGMIPEILNNLTVDCCQTCQAHGASFVDFVQNGRNMSAFQHNELDVQALIDDTNDLSFPVYGWKWQDRYQGIYRYIPLVESPGFAFLLKEPETESPLKAVVSSIIDTWPYILITLMMALLAGIVIWFLDTAYNEEQFPHSYLRGVGNGWWWAFISMTTLGYGDKVPAATHSKVFAVIWVLTGLVVYGILSGSITTAFTTIVYQSSTQLYGSKVATIADTPEYRFAVRRNAKVNTEANYTSFEEVLQALVDRKVTGMLMDAYEAGTKREQFLKSGGLIRIHKVYDFASTFGVVLAGRSTRLYQCSRNWMSGHRAEMSAHIAKFIKVVQEEEVNEMVEITTGLFDPESSVFKGFLQYSLIALAILAIPGVIWEIFYQIRKRKKNKLAADSAAKSYKEIMVREMSEFTLNFLKNLEIKLINLREKHKAELRAFLRRKNLKDNDSFQQGKGHLPIEQLKDKKFFPSR